MNNSIIAHFFRDITLPKTVTDLISRRLNDPVSTAELLLHLQVCCKYLEVLPLSLLDMSLLKRHLCAKRWTHLLKFIHFKCPYVTMTVCVAWHPYCHAMPCTLPSNKSLTSLAALSPSARRSLSIFLDLSAASFSIVVLTAHPILKFGTCCFIEAPPGC